MALSSNSKTNDRGRSLRHKLLVIQALVIGLPIVIITYVYFSTNIRLNISQLLILALTLILILAGLISLRHVMDRFTMVTNLIKNTEGSDKFLIEMQKDTTELHDIIASFNSLMTNFEETTQELRRRIFELFAIKELNEIASKSLNVNKLLNALLEKAMDVTKSEIGSVFLVNSEKRLFRVVASKGLESGLQVGSYIDFNKSPVSKVVSSKKTLLVQNIEANSGTIKPEDAQNGPTSYLSTPIFARDHLIAVLNLSSWGENQTYDSADNQILSIMIGEIGFALENALLHSKIEQNARKLKKRTLELTKTNDELVKEINDRKQAEKALLGAHDELEKRVMERTDELAKANEELLTEIAEAMIEIADRAKKEKRLRLAKETAEAANLAKTQFLANVSHELRTPLNSIIGFSEILKVETYGKLNEKQAKHTKNIVNSGRHLLNLINEILDLTKIDSGHAKLELLKFDIPTVLNEALDTIKTLADKKDINLSVETEQGVSTITADQVKFRQILFNLLSNGIKFTPEGKDVKVTARILGSKNEKAQPEIEISVIDNGIGVKPEDQERIFNAFEQADSSFTKHFEGTGLGLALTKKLVELHGGRIWVESEGKGKGSTFTFTLPA